MIELLARLEPNTSQAFADARRRLSEEEKQISRVANRQRTCGGIKLSHAYCASTRSRNTDALNAAAVGYAVSGMRPIAFAAAWLASNGSEEARRVLNLWLLDEFKHLPKTWKRGRLSDAEVQLRYIGLIELATWGLKNPTLSAKQVTKYTHLGVSKTQWRDVWKARYEPFRSLLGGLVAEADDHMKLRLDYEKM